MLTARRDGSVTMTSQVQSDTELMAAAAKAAGIQPPDIVQPEERWVPLNGIRFHYLDWGNPQLPHVVLLHGGSLTAHTWDMAALLLRDRYHLVALDQRGHGDTEWTPEGELGRDNSELMLEDTRQFIEHLGYEHLTLVGMSMGGMNAIRYAARHPERLDALAIVDIAPETMREGLVEMEQFRQETETLRRFDDFLERAIRFMPHRAPEHLRYSLTHSLKQTEQGWTWKQDHRPRPMAELSEPERATGRAQSADALWADVRAIRVPTILFRGANSKILAADVAARTVAAMRDARLVVIPRATHNVHSDNPADFAAALNAFLSDVLPKPETPAPMLERATAVVMRAARLVGGLARRGDVEFRARSLQSRLNREYSVLGRALHPLLQDGRLTLPIDMPELRQCITAIVGLTADLDRAREEAKQIRPAAGGPPRTT
ncbi:MAG: alpha/beta hydrolase [Dehalococcoidia bacterium]|nr:alpha/beta hydrolase [Dehalococcoidia bacterium]